jgi:hypothetical protein
MPICARRESLDDVVRFRRSARVEFDSLPVVGYSVDRAERQVRMALVRRGMST